MPTPYSVAQIIDIAKVSQYLAAEDVQKQPALWGKLDKSLSRILYIERKSVEWKYLNNQTNDTDLINSAYYLYDLCGRFGLEAQRIISNGGTSGSTTTPMTPTGTTKPKPIEDNGDSLFPPGESTFPIPSLAGYNIIFCRNEYTESQIDRGGSYYRWDVTTGTLSVYPARQSGELFQIYPI